MTQVALHGLFDYITTLNLSDRSLDWLTDKLQSIKKKRKAQALDPEIAKIPEQYRCDPYEISPSGDPFFADKRNVEYVRKCAEAAAKEEDLLTIHGHDELDKFLETL
jgi:DNA repair photolyase